MNSVVKIGARKAEKGTCHCKKCCEEEEIVCEYRSEVEAVVSPGRHDELNETK